MNASGLRKRQLDINVDSVSILSVGWTTVCCLRSFLSTSDDDCLL